MVHSTIGRRARERQSERRELEKNGAGVKICCKTAVVSCMGCRNIIPPGGGYRDMSVDGKNVGSVHASNPVCINDAYRLAAKGSGKIAFLTGCHGVKLHDYRSTDLVRRGLGMMQAHPA